MLSSESSNQSADAKMYSMMCGNETGEPIINQTKIREIRWHHQTHHQTKKTNQAGRWCWCRRMRLAPRHLTFILLLLLVAPPTVTSTIILNSGVAPTQPPVAAFPLSACPSVCFCDETNYVNCVGDDSLWEVPADLPRTVARLELRNYAIGTLTVQGALHELLDLHEVKLQQTKIASIENGTFGNLTRLLRLDLSQNLMERISSAMFEGLTSLRYLDLSSNRVADMDEAFVDLVNLEQLNLRDNRLPQLTVKSFPGLYKIQYLNLDSNRIASVEVGTFQYLTGLAHLIVSNNPLTALSRLDFFGSRLQYIDVSRVGLQRVPQSLTRYVRDLRLAKNNLTHVRLGDFDSYPYISLLVLDDNKIEEIEGDALGRQEYLVRLWLNGNRLQRVPANLPPGLRVLYAEENLLRALPALSFQGLFNLEQLFLQRNLIERIDACAFCDLLSLRHLNLQANLLETIGEGAFANLSSLLSLDLSQNPIKTLAGGCFAGLDALRTLQLSRIKTFGRLVDTVFAPLKRLDTLEVYDSPALATQLVNSTRALQSLRALRELNLQHNNLVALRSDFAHFFPQLKVVKLNGNMWNCSSRDVRWLSAWINRTEIQFYHSYDIRCAEPASLQHKPLITLRENDFKVAATTTTTKTVASTTATTTSTDAIVLSDLSSNQSQLHDGPATKPTTSSTQLSSTQTTDSLAATTTTNNNNNTAPLTTQTEINKNASTISTSADTQISNSTSGDINLLPIIAAVMPALNETVTSFNSSSSSIANMSSISEGSGLDLEISNQDGEYDEMDIVVDWTPSPTPVQLATSEPESTASLAVTIPSTVPPISSKTIPVIASAIPELIATATTHIPNQQSANLTSDPLTVTAINTTTIPAHDLAAVVLNSTTSTINTSSTETRTDSATTILPPPPLTLSRSESTFATNIHKNISESRPESTFATDTHKTISATIPAPPSSTHNGTTHAATPPFDLSHNRDDHDQSLVHHTHNSNCTVSVTQATDDSSAVVAAGSVAAGVALLLLGLTLSALLCRYRRKYWPLALTGGSPSSSYSFCSLSSASTAGGAANGSGGGLSALINRHMRRSSSSSISYSPQRDEVSIVTVSEGTVGLRTLTHQGLSNKLYFVLENGADPAAADTVNKEALPDASLHELLPSPGGGGAGGLTNCTGDGSQAGDPLLCPLYAHPRHQDYSHHPPHNRKSWGRERSSTSTYCFTT